jgi:hypothetical protein
MTATSADLGRLGGFMARIQVIVVSTLVFAVLTVIGAVVQRAGDNAALRASLADLHGQIESLAAQNERLRGENDARWRENVKSKTDRYDIHDTLKRLDERSDYLDQTVRGLIKAERERQQRRKAEAGK